MKKFNQFISEAYSHKPGDKPKTWSDGIDYLRNYVEGGDKLKHKYADEEAFENWHRYYGSKKAVDVVWNDMVKQSSISPYPVTEVDTGKKYQAVTLGAIAYIRYENSILFGLKSRLRKTGKSAFLK